MKIAVLDIGGTSIKAGEFNSGLLHNISEFDTNAKAGGFHVMQRVKEILHSYNGFEKIGISTAGQVDSVRGVIKYANSNIPDYTGMEVKRILQEEFRVPVTVENDVNAAALGELGFGAGRGYSDFLCLTYGTGVGGAIVAGGNIYRGSGFSAGEFGGIVTHASVRNEKTDIFSGCYERYASVTALVEKAKQIDGTLINGREIFERLNDERVLMAVDEWIMEIIYGLTTLVHIFNPACVVLGGGVMKQKYILDKIKDVLYNNIMESYRNVEIRGAELGNNAGLYGALQMSLSSLR